MFSQREISKFKSKAFSMGARQQVGALDHGLLEWSSKIKPDENVMKEKLGYAQRIAEILKQKSVYKIDRLSFAGSFGKRTNTMESDVDCVYFINDQKPPFDEILKEFYSICLQPSVKNMFNTFDVKLNKKSIKFTINNLEMDLVLATNFAKGFEKHGSKRIHQLNGVLEQIKLNPAKNCFMFSSALAESSVDFMKRRCSFANEMARIAKYWFQKLGFHISGASTFIELVAVYAARKGRRGNRKHCPYLKAFSRFLEALMSFENLNVSFNRCNPIFKQHIADNISAPRVIDPTNPYHNFAGYWSNDDIQLLKRSAAITFERMQQLVLSPLATNDEEKLVMALLH